MGLSFSGQLTLSLTYLINVFYMENVGSIVQKYAARPSIDSCAVKFINIMSLEPGSLKTFGLNKIKKFC